MDTPPNGQPLTEKCSSLKIETSVPTMSPVTNLAFNLSSLTMPLTPCRRISWSSPVPNPTAVLTKRDTSINSPVSDDSPTFQEGVLKGFQAKKKSFKDKSHIFRRLPSYSPTCQNKENVNRRNVAKPIAKSVQYLPFSDSTESDSLDEFSGASQESGFVDHRSFASQSSVASVRSSVFTDEELDEDEDTMFSVDKFIEDEPATGLSSSMTKLLTGPLKEPADQHFKKFSPVDPCQIKTKSLRRCLSMVIHPETESKSYISYQEVFEKTIYDLKEEDDKKEKIVSKFPFKRPEPLDHGITPLQSKRRKSSPTVTIPSSSRSTYRSESPLVRCYSDTSATIMKAVQKSDQQPDLIGDCSKKFALPLVKGRHPDLKTISTETLMKLLKGEFNTSVKDYLVVDCRYPYEFSGGHIIGAKNIYTKDDIFRILLLDAELSEDTDQRSVIIFHCEFSSERAPKLLRFLRNKDRELNENVYPRLHHPEVYILEGGYKAFYQEYKDFCEPQEYKPMLHKDHTEELKEFQKEGKSKSWGKVREVQNYGVKTRKLPKNCDD